MAKTVNYGDMNFALKNGINMPAVGLGTYRLNTQELMFQTIDYALASGYRLFDTAPDYGNEKLMRDAFKQLLPKYGLTRKELFITSKLSVHSRGSKFISKAFERSLENLGLDYIDMYLVHFPGPPNSDSRSTKNEALRADTWMAITKLYDESKVNAIGVSNFTLRHLMQLTEIMAIGPMVNQIEWHPYYYQLEMLQYCCDHNIRLQAYCSFGGLSRGHKALMEDPVVKKIAQIYDSTTAQVLLVWALQRGIAVIPKSTSLCHMQQNKNLNFRLSEGDLNALDALSIKNRKYAWDPTGIA
ncbi:uncharacterized oxidoreductase YtbE-like [Vanessa cardui]|uniref:uncharacterized oxidoreductase YtbE-like n=1 Tax=Vanessa cardui TaxID=171605 RepID=UPI001F12FD70|nr:uncharacterized oxidoreductase YtbE-like [Vanessa cardui]